VPLLERGVPVPAALARVVDDALVDQPAIRFGSAAALRAELVARYGEPGRQ
jgi:hypothetical protein